MNAVTVRLYVIQPDGELQLLLEADADYFGGGPPNVGDVVSFFSDTRPSLPALQRARPRMGIDVQRGDGSRSHKRRGDMGAR